MLVAYVGDFTADRAEELRLAALRGDAEPLFCSNVDEARSKLSAAGQPVPRCVLIDGGCPGAEGFVSWLRGEARLFSVPVVALVPALDEAAFCETHAFGIDDVVVTGDPDAISRRLQHLQEFDPESRPPITQGRAIVAHGDRGRRQVLGRVLRQNGFDVSFAADADELVQVASAGDEPKLVVGVHDLGSRSILEAVEQVRSARDGQNVPFVVLGAARDLRSLGREADGLGRVAVTSELAPPDNLLFLANELMRPDVTNVRASARLLFGALASYRPAGELESSHGLTYTLSREGLYVRTLDAPPRGTEIWLELRPPRGERLVHLTATVVWRRGLSTAAGGASPPGFGVRILAESCAGQNLQAYYEGYERLRAEPRVFN